MYRVDRNNFYEEVKKATVYTPQELSQFLFSLLGPHLDQDSLVLDPCVGEGSLLRPFDSHGYRTLGIDIEDQGYSGKLIIKNYLEVEREELPVPSLVLMNPPFNIDAKTREYVRASYGRRPLLPEVWLQKTLELFGRHIPLVMFTPYGFRLNQTATSKRWQQFHSGEYPEIKSIISLPKNVFEGILFHSEILVFNVEGLKAHYFYFGDGVKD